MKSNYLITDSGRECTKCKEFKSWDMFCTGSGARGKNTRCLACRNSDQRKQRAQNKNKYTSKYEKTERGFLMRLYRNMKSRVSGIQKEKLHLYENRELIEKEDFYIWAIESQRFHTLFLNWAGSSYDRKLTPSVDRVDSSRGYTTDNMEWVTHSENSSRGARNRHDKA